ncbi:MAG: hypothetical protein C4294_19675 [Nitrospiraceae bacterium]
MKLFSFRQCLLYVLLVVLLGSINRISLTAQASGENTPPANHCSNCFHQAAEQQYVTAWGGWAYIPNLNSGRGSYHRVAVFQLSPFRFAEIGWIKTNTFGSYCGWWNTFCAQVSWDSGSGNQNFSSAISQATHLYSLQYDPNTQKYWFYVDGSNIFNQNANFSSGTIGAGGEVVDGVESMAHTQLYDLRYLQRNGDGSFVFVSWNGHVNYRDDPPYYNTDNGPNSFYDDGN